MISLECRVLLDYCSLECTISPVIRPEVDRLETSEHRPSVVVVVEDRWGTLVYRPPQVEGLETMASTSGIVVGPVERGRGVLKLPPTC